ncbi:MAG: S41 family peptidase [Chloroflexota bacterium]
MTRTIKFALGIILVAILVLVFGAGYQMGSDARISRGSDLGTVQEVWNLLSREYVEPDRLDPEEYSRAAIDGILNKLNDPYTSYLNANDFELGMSDLRGAFQGIGAHVTIRDDRLTVIAPIAGSPAEEAGILPGDAILEVDGVATANLSLAEAVLKIRGPEGTPVRLLILHEGAADPLEIVITRARVEITSVAGEMRGEIAYIKITEFSDNTDEELLSVLTKLTPNARGIVLDLRSNPGGLLGTVVEIASYFLKDGTVAMVRYSDQTVTTENVRKQSFTTDLPMVVLVDSHSASGSEVLSGALQDRHRALIAGTTTFGKGSVNILRGLSDGSGLYITTARWLTPDGRLIEGQGIVPDQELTVTGEDAIRWAIGYLTGNP